MATIQLSNQELLARKLTVFLFLEENICCGYSLEAPKRVRSYGLLTSTHNICFRREIRKYISYNLSRFSS